ncbi:hypothetical protein MKX01_034059 [Papaver californicum]|nr:hypothetical protein MKX01_034059 [Papaver californicum]
MNSLNAREIDFFKKFLEETRSSPMKATIVYEASFCANQGEKFLKEVQEFSVSFPKEYITMMEEEVEGEGDNNNRRIMLKKIVRHALVMPLHWDMPRVQTRWFTGVYEMMEEDMNPLILEFAKLDFNMVQAIYQEDLKYISRDRWVETFYWGVGNNYEPYVSGYRRHLTKLSCLLTAINDMHDIYASPDDVLRFSDAIERWDVNTLEDLSYFMKICFMAIFSLLNDIAYDILKKHEYLNNAWISVGGAGILPTVSFFNVVKEPTKEALECINNFSLSDIKRYAFEIVRLTNDLGTSSDELNRGAVPTSIQCYMHETGVTNNDKFSRSAYPESFIVAMENFARASHALYQFDEGYYGDGYGVASGSLTKSHITSLFFEPISVWLN